MILWVGVLIGHQPACLVLVRLDMLWTQRSAVLDGLFKQVVMVHPREFSIIFSGPLNLFLSP
jgi:hypothetical protein